MADIHVRVAEAKTAREELATQRGTVRLYLNKTKKSKELIAVITITQNNEHMEITNNNSLRTNKREKLTNTKLQKEKWTVFTNIRNYVREIKKLLKHIASKIAFEAT